MTLGEFVSENVKLFCFMSQGVNAGNLVFCSVDDVIVKDYSKFSNCSQHNERQRHQKDFYNFGSYLDLVPFYSCQVIDSIVTTSTKYPLRAGEVEKKEIAITIRVYGDKLECLQKDFLGNCVAEE
jgi:hypothetical protein